MKEDGLRIKNAELKKIKNVKKNKMTPESKLKKEVKEYLQKSGWFIFHIRQGKHCHKGISDNIAIKEGVVAFIEYKSEKGKLSPEQLLFQLEVVQHGGKYEVIRSLEDAVKLNEYVRQAVY